MMYLPLLKVFHNRIIKNRFKYERPNRIVEDSFKKYYT